MDPITSRVRTRSLTLRRSRSSIIPQLLASVLGALPLVLLGRSASALDIQFSYDDSIAARADVVAGMERATRMWEAVLDDPVTVIIDVVEAPIFELGFAHAGTYVNLAVARYDHARAALFADATSADDLLATSHLPDVASLTFRAVEPDGTPTLFDGQENVNMYLAVHAGLVHAADFQVDPTPETAAARIAWNTSFLDIEGLLDRDRSDGIEGADLVSIAAHEIGHALGFDSSTGVFDETSFPNGPYAPEDQREFAVLNMLDLFRYTAESLPHIDVAPGGEPYFSIDGGATRLADFGNGVYNGDGEQAGHWRDVTDGAEVGLMDSSLAEGIAHEFSKLDLLAMDVIGWDVTPPLAGDYDASRMVEQGDLELVVSNWGRDAAAPPNDWLFDLPTGLIDQTDLDRVLLGWGDASLSRIQSRAIPEPATLGTFVACMCILAGRRLFRRLFGEPRDMPCMRYSAQGLHQLGCLAYTFCIVLGWTSAAAADPVRLDATGHFYDFVPTAPDTSWTEAKDAAEAQVWDPDNSAPLQGYLATITLLEEDEFLRSTFGPTLRQVWIGGTDAAVEGEWRWVTGPESQADDGAGLLFWRGGSNGQAFGYAGWISGIEPNNFGNENYLVWGHNARGWNDSLHQPYPARSNDAISGYFVEFGGMPTDPDLPGDYNNNGRVEQADLDLILLNWGNDAATIPADWSNDLPSGFIDQAELDKVLLSWGNSVARAAAGATAVPEPPAVALLMAAVTAIASVTVNASSCFGLLRKGR